MTPRILIAADGCASTGFARVSHAVLERLIDRWDVHHLLNNHRHLPRARPRWQVYARDIEGDPGGFAKLERLARTLSPDIVMLLHDTRVMGLQLDELRGVPGCTVAYCPIEGAITHAPAIQRLAGADALVSFTRFGANVLGATERELSMQLPGYAMPPVFVVPHGVDRGRFYPLPAHERASARRALFGDRPGIDEAFVVLNANRNQPRKRIDSTLRGFALFARERPDALLCLHMGLLDYGVDVRALAKELGIADRLLLTSSAEELPDFSDERLNLVYNACDVGINTSMGEGWGLVAFEHGATGAAQIMPRHSALTELWEGHAELIVADDPFVDRWSYMEQLAVRPEAVARALARLYEDRGHCRRLGEAAMRVAARPEYDWDVIATQFDELFRGLLERGAGRPARAVGDW